MSYRYVHGFDPIYVKYKKCENLQNKWFREDTYMEKLSREVEE